MKEFGQDKKHTGFCPICGLALYDDQGCPKYHKVKKERIGRYSGQSKRPYGKYEDH